MAVHKKGYSEQAISQNIKKSKNAVHNAIVKLWNTRTYSTTQKPSRPRKTTLRDDHAIRRIAARSPTSLSKKIRFAQLLKGTDNIRRTIRRRLVDDFNLKAHEPAYKPGSRNEPKP